MKKISRKIVMFTAFAILISSVGVFANDYPDKPIEMVDLTHREAVAISPQESW